jgi:hypothetical protein
VHRVVGTHQSAHGAVKRMPVVPPELGVGSLERGVTVGLRLLDTAMPSISCCSQIYASISIRSEEMDGPSGGSWRVCSGAEECVPVSVVLLGLVVLRRVLGFYTALLVPSYALSRGFINVLAMATVVDVDLAVWYCRELVNFDEEWAKPGMR